MGEADQAGESAPALVDAGDGQDPLEQLTAKQREVLDLLIEHKTSKEISRLLGISPHTVDQRIMFARAKLNVATRGEVAHAYRRLLAERGLLGAPDPVGSIYERPVYGSSHIAETPAARQDSRQEDPVEHQPVPNAWQSGPALVLAAERPLTQPYYRVLPEVFDGPNGTLMRLGAIALIAVLLILIVLGSLAMFAQLSELMDH